MTVVGVISSLEPTLNLVHLVAALLQLEPELEPEESDLTNV